MVVATMRYLPDVSPKILCLIGDNKRYTMEETISDAFRHNAPYEIAEMLVIRVDKIDENTYILVHHTEDNAEIQNFPRSVLVTLSRPPIYGKD